VIDVINLNKNYGKLEVLRGITTTIKKGEKIAIIGPSGSGKSTFLRCLNCMEDPTSGEIIFEGVNIAGKKVDINIHRRHMGMVFQQFNLFNNKTVIDNIMLAPVYLETHDLRMKKFKNFFIKIRNIFSRDKKALRQVS
jgi:polar amino acid transport system ATP-binding protein